MKSSKSDLQFAKELEAVIQKLRKRVGRFKCQEMDLNCFDCKTRVLIGLINSLIDVLT